jgi:lysozyme family protein
MQHMLKECGYDVEDDGFIGPKTMEAVNQLREKTGLPLESVEELIEELEEKKDK